MHTQFYNKTECPLELFMIIHLKVLASLFNRLENNTLRNNVLYLGLAAARGGSRTAATSKMEFFVIIVNCFQPLTIITKSSILDIAAALYPPLAEF